MITKSVAAFTIFFGAIGFVYGFGDNPPNSRPTCCIKNAYCCSVQARCCGVNSTTKDHAVTAPAETGGLVGNTCCVKHAYCCTVRQRCCPKKSIGSEIVTSETAAKEVASAATAGNTCCAKRAYCCSTKQSCCGKTAKTPLAA